MPQFITKAGDTADSIAWAYYGTTDGNVVERLLQANKGLSNHGPQLPAGLVVNLPDLPTIGQKQGVRLWD